MHLLLCTDKGKEPQNSCLQMLTLLFGGDSVLVKIPGAQSDLIYSEVASSRWCKRGSFLLSTGKLIYIPFLPGGIGWCIRLPTAAWCFPQGETIPPNPASQHTVIAFVSSCHYRKLMEIEFNCCCISPYPSLVVAACCQRFIIYCVKQWILSSTHDNQSSNPYKDVTKSTLIKE